MKRLCGLIAICLLVALGSYAQDKNGFYAGLSVGFANEQPDNHFQVSPMIGYKINPRWAVGVQGTLQTGDRNTNKLTVFGDYSFLKLKKWDIFTELNASWLFEDYGDSDLPGSSDDGDKQECGLSLGANYAVSKHIGFFVKSFFLGYCNSVRANDGAVIGGGKFIFDSNWRRVAVGLRVVF